MKGAARAVGLLLLLQGLGGPVLNFVLLQPLMGAPGFLANGAAHPGRFGLAVVLGLVLGAMNVGIAVAAWPALRPRSERFALALFAAAAAALVLMAAEMSGVFAMALLSRAHSAASGIDAERIAALAPLLTAMRGAAHFLGLIAGCAMVSMLHAALLRTRLVPRWLAGAGVAAGVLALGAAAMPLFGGRVALGLMAPLGVANLALTGWLLVRGFRPPERG
jgi:hypothetical protein